ncbi:undecaprenyldiphospho-muramoylpentapeptide beta-N-acetylglucosaminyltransferase [Limibacillus halophilus]
MSAARQRLAVLAAGGTGGHMFPARALAEELLGRSWRVALVTDKRGGGFGESLPQVETRQVRAGAVAGGGFLGKVKGLANLAVGTLQALSFLASRRPDVVVGFGGYASIPALAAAAQLRRPILLHEQNAVAGRANRLMAPRARVIATAYESVKGLSERDQAKARLIGNPVRPAIEALGKTAYEAPAEEGPLRLLVVGGSQGARIFNEVVPAALELLPEALRARLELSQQTPGEGQAEIAQRYEAAGVKAELRPFFEDIPERLAAAQLVICRAGASTIAELSAAGRPAILVPFPSAADDHQTANAQAFSHQGGGWVMPQQGLTPERLAARLTELFERPSVLSQAAAAAKALGRPQAASRLADAVVSAAGEKQPAIEEAA